MGIWQHACYKINKWFWVSDRKLGRKDHRKWRQDKCNPVLAWKRFKRLETWCCKRGFRWDMAEFPQISKSAWWWQCNYRRDLDRCFKIFTWRYVWFSNELCIQGCCDRLCKGRKRTGCDEYTWKNTWALSKGSILCNDEPCKLTWYIQSFIIPWRNRWWQGRQNNKRSIPKIWDNLWSCKTKTVSCSFHAVYICRSTYNLLWRWNRHGRSRWSWWQTCIWMGQRK